MNRRIYLDHSATTPVDPRVLEAMLPYLKSEYGNPSSVHVFGRETRIAVEQAREEVAGLIGARPSEIVFTAGGTEADNMAIIGTARACRAKGTHVISCGAEHHAVLHATHALSQDGFDVTYVPCDGYGMVHCEEISKALRKDTILVSIMHANNEVGAINPIADIGALTRQHGVLFHTDAVQSFGKLPLDVKAMGIDLLSVSAHKLYGPKGIGALYIRQGTLFSPLTYGGAQERGQRAGTENVAGIVGLGKATEICRSQMAQEEAQLNRLRNVLWNQLKAAVPSSILNGHPDKRLPGHLNLSIPGIHGDDLVTQLDLEGFAVSTGSACTSGAVRVSHVLEAMGTVQEIARGAVRISMGRQTTEPDIADLVTAIRSITHRSSA